MSSIIRRLLTPVPTNVSHLSIRIKKGPIRSIEIPPDLSSFHVKADLDICDTDVDWCEMNSKDCFKTMESIESLIRPKYPEAGILSQAGTVCSISSCKKLDQIEDGLNKERMRTEGFDHTIQYPVKSLQENGYLDESQVRQINAYITQQSLPKFCNIL